MEPIANVKLKVPCLPWHVIAEGPKRHLPCLVQYLL